MEATTRVDSSAAINMKAIHRLAATGWAAGIVVACVLMLAAPPTAAFGAWGWAAGVGIQAASLAGRIGFARRGPGVSPRLLLVVTWLLPVDIGLMQWLGGGWAAPYHELLLLSLILGSAWLPPRRFAPFAAMVAAVALGPPCTRRTARRCSTSARSSSSGCSSAPRCRCSWPASGVRRASPGATL